ncbi:sensor domain-containing protein [Pseudoduganella lutea]|uniref:EAL domain-containing protein n=1 Tax=Pseudoduganella lutea TaxID=321985 RepID=A0A4P6L3R9_9BURK|nr:EAL domain-containing protein [Pseudoduganella lutea]QBE66159.1 EAL domain-containing protein [Pseudoduganella lutea]
MMRFQHRALKRSTLPLQGRGWRSRRPLTRFDDLFQDHPQPMWIYDLVTLRFLRVNAAACRHYGYDEAEFLHMTIREIRPPSEQARLSADIAAAAHALPQSSGVWTHLKRDGRPILVRISSHALIYEGRRARLVFALDVTQQVATERALYKSEQLYRRLIDTMPLQVFWKDLGLRYVGCNRLFARASGLDDPASVVGKRDHDFIRQHAAAQGAHSALAAEKVHSALVAEKVHSAFAAENAGAALEAEDRMVIETGRPVRGREQTLVAPDGRQRWHLVNKLPLHGQHGEIVGLLGTIEDITASREAGEKLRLQSRALDASVNAILITRRAGSDDVIEYANPAFARISGYELAEVVGQDCRFLQGTDRDQEGMLALREALHGDREVTVELRNYRKDGTLFWNQLHVAPVLDSHGATTHWVGVINDITASKRYQQELEHQSTHDALTGLPNRNLFHDRLEQAIAYAARYEHQLWVVVLDLDNFKLINDTLGHAVGDSLLQTVAGRLRNALRDSDTVARLGGDEFILLLPDQPGQSDGTLSPRTVQAVLDAVSAPMRLGAHDLALTCSMGVSVFPRDGDTAPSLFKHADIALYRAKDGGRNQLQFYTSEMNARVTERTLIEGHLRNALPRQEFVLYFQPRIDCVTGRVAGLEALLRWRQPELGLVQPDRFIGVAEETGRIVEIGEWVLHEACRQAKAWQDAGLLRVPVAVNVSARQFRQAGFVQEVRGALEASGLAAEYLELELTESLMMQNIEAVIMAMRNLKESGVRLSIDDFGTGYSSLSYLRRFPLDYLKIDRSFVRDMLHDAPGSAIVRSMITLGHSLGCRIIAEGVETSDQLGYLTQEGCDEIQGYLCSRPLPGEQAGELLYLEG